MKYKYIRSIALQTLANFSNIIDDDNNKVYSLILHSVPDNEIDIFRKFLFYLKDKVGFITPQDFNLFLNGDISFEGKRLLLTFDDGFYSNYVVAKNILNALEIKAIFFVPTAFIDMEDFRMQKNFVINNLRCHGVNCEIKSMGWDELIELSEMGHEIGSHTVNHCNLAKIKNNKELINEIVKSRAQIEKKLNKNIHYFAFPFGDINSINQEALSIVSSNYKYCFSGIRGVNTIHTNKLTIRREALNMLDGLKYNYLVANGYLSFYYYNQRRTLDNLII